jgi:hypothetical protein
MAMGFEEKVVGWVERSETHQSFRKFAFDAV